MATRSTIAMADGDNIKAIYCHYDGYPEGVGVTLSNFYNDSDKVAELVALGDISTLDEFVVPVGTQHSFETPEVGVTVAYGRDRNETGTEARYYTTVENWLEAYGNTGCEFGYLWFPNTKTWTTWEVRTRKVLSL